MEKSELTARARDWVLAAKKVDREKVAVADAEKDLAEAEREAGMIFNELLAAFKGDGSMRTHRIFLPEDEGVEATIVRVRVNSAMPSVESDPVDYIGEGPRFPATGGEG